MKINEHYSLKSHGVDKLGTGHNRLDPRRATFIHTTGFNMQVGYLEAYALYFSKYIQEYRKNGVNISMVMPQNEIAWQPAWPSCTWRPEDLAIFVGKFLAPQFKKDGIDTEIWLGTVNYPNPDYVRAFLKTRMQLRPSMVSEYNGRESKRYRLFSANTPVIVTCRRKTNAATGKRLDFA